MKNNRAAVAHPRRASWAGAGSSERQDAREALVCIAELDPATLLGLGNEVSLGDDEPNARRSPDARRGRR
jgi:hypothetical protein